MPPPDPPIRHNEPPRAVSVIPAKAGEATPDRNVDLTLSESGKRKAASPSRLPEEKKSLLAK
jgi:hypothetical protein